MTGILSKRFHCDMNTSTFRLVNINSVNQTSLQIKTNYMKKSETLSSENGNDHSPFSDDISQIIQLFSIAPPSPSSVQIVESYLLRFLKRIIYKYFEMAHRHADLHGIFILFKKEKEKLFIMKEKLFPANFCQKPIVASHHLRKKLENNIFFHNPCKFSKTPSSSSSPSSPISNKMMQIEHDLDDARTRKRKHDEEEEDVFDVSDYSSETQKLLLKKRRVTTRLQPDDANSIGEMEANCWGDNLEARSTTSFEVEEEYSSSSSSKDLKNSSLTKKHSLLEGITSLEKAELINSLKEDLEITEFQRNFLHFDRDYKIFDDEQTRSQKQKFLKWLSVPKFFFTSTRSNEFFERNNEIFFEILMDFIVEMIAFFSEVAAVCKNGNIVCYSSGDEENNANGLETIHFEEAITRITSEELAYCSPSTYGPLSNHN